MAMIFGTDGVRGEANVELTPELALALGRAAAQVLASGPGRARLLVGRDTRASGDMLEAAAVAGICSAGVDAIVGGVLPTPALAFLIRSRELAGGVMISASHNPARDNGLKFFGRNGDKLSQEQESAVEALVVGLDEGGDPVISAEAIGRVEHRDDLVSVYQRHAISSAAYRLHGMRVVVDCAHGALSHIAPAVLEALGAEVVAVNCAPDGLNINEGGAVRPQHAAGAVLEHAAHAGVAFDGDGDRVVLVDERGRTLDGDQMLAIWAGDLARRGELSGGVVVGTVISNGGLEAYLQSIGVRFARAPVGDRFVAAEMAASGAVLGGEACGHIIYRPYLSSCDGLFTAIMILGLAARSGLPLSALSAAMVKRPQTSVNIPVDGCPNWPSLPDVRRAIAQAEEALGREGRLVVRPSGTEPLIRITCECADGDRARGIAEDLVKALSESMARSDAHADRTV